MKAFLIKNILLFLCFIRFGMTAEAQERSALIPDYALVQHAGSIGYLSLGAGYELFDDARGSLELTYGRVPEVKGGPLNIVSAKFSYRPVELRVNNTITAYPANPGVFLSYHLDEQFGLGFDREQYGRSYYGWPTALRGHLSLSNEVAIKTGEKLKSVTLYSEFNVNDLYLVSLFYKNNKQWLSPFDIIKLGFGVKVGF